MTRQERILKVAKSKVRQTRRSKHDRGPVLFCGHLTPCELLALVKAGIRMSGGEHGEFQVEWAKEKKKIGDSSPRWHYFYLGKVTLDN